MYNKVMLHIAATHASSWKDKVIGLIGKKEIKPLFFQTRWGIHTFGVRKPIDVVILDDEQTIVAIKQNLKPNRIFFWNPKYQNVLELPINVYHLKIGEKIELQS